MFRTTAHNNACFAIAKKIVNDYDLWFNGWVIQNIGAWDMLTPLYKELPYDYWSPW